MHAQKHNMDVQRKERGFTLVEALVSVLILSASLVTITSLLTRTLQASMASQEFLVASKLAQEGIEIIRVKRNNNLIAEREWNANIAAGVYEFDSDAVEDILGEGLLIPDEEYEAPAHFEDTGEGLTPFRVYTSGINAGQYTYSEGPTTEFVMGNFRRKVTITSIPTNTDSLAVTVKVYYGGNPPFELSSIIYNAS
jgi:type II secretory pathway pseudopilin PulG